MSRIVIAFNRVIWGCLALSLVPPFIQAQEAAKPEVKEEPVAPVPVKEQVAAIDAKLQEANARSEKVRGEYTELQRQLFDLNLKLKIVESERQTLSQSQADLQKQAEKLLIDSGDWVSFSQQIAPIFNNHCIACHNARNPQGQYNMSNYSAILGEGQSGKAVIPGKPAESPLFQFIADHSMPQDADPLSAEQTELVRKWIETGARIDSTAKPDAELFRIVPRPTYPTPPEHYTASLPISAVAISPDGKLLATSGYHEVLIWSLPEGGLIKRISNVAQRVYAIAFFPDGKRISVASGTPGRVGEAKIFDLESGKMLIDVMICQDSALALALSPDSKRMAIGEVSGTISIYTIDEKSAELNLRIEDHSDWVQSLSWSVDGRRLVSASRDKTCKVYDSTSGKSITTFSGHQQSVTSAVFREDGQHVMSVGDDGRMRIWNLDEGKQIHELKGTPNAATISMINSRRVLVTGSTNEALIVDSQNAKLVERKKLSSKWNSVSVVDAARQKAIVGNHFGQVNLFGLSEADTAIAALNATP